MNARTPVGAPVWASSGAGAVVRTTRPATAATIPARTDEADFRREHIEGILGAPPTSVKDRGARRGDVPTTFGSVSDIVSTGLPPMELHSFLFDCLWRAGVREIFGIPGDFVLNLYEALED